MPLVLQVDYLLSKLSSLEGRISGTEDQLNIEMDHRYKRFRISVSLM